MNKFFKALKRLTINIGIFSYSYRNGRHTL